MSHEELISFLAGATSVAELIAAGWFLRFWKRTRDPLFRSFAIAFFLFSGDQVIRSVLGVDDERTGYAYLLRVVGFVVILAAILGKNLRTPAGHRSKD